MATVTFQNATRVYPGADKPAVDKLNLEIADGEFLVLVRYLVVVSPPHFACLLVSKM